MDPTPAFPPQDDLDWQPLRRPLVAVLPFSAPAGDEQLRLLGSELADTLREGLARLPAFRAILISSEFLEQAPAHAVELVCRQLRVGHLVAGHCYRPPMGASLYVELTETRHWHVLWAQFFRGNALSLLADHSPALEALEQALQDAFVAQPVR